MTAYHRGANDGLTMGILLTAAFLLQSHGLTGPAWALWAGDILMFAVPFLAYALLRKGFAADKYRSHFSVVWMHGITMFICGCLILGLVSYAYMRFLRPLFIADMFHAVANLYAQLGTPEADKMAHTFEAMIAQGLIPTPIALAFSMMWLGSFLGAMLSLVITVILKAIYKPSKM